MIYTQSIFMLIVAVVICTVFATFGGFWFALIMLLIEFKGDKRFTRESPKEPKRKNVHKAYHWIDGKEYREYLQSDEWKIKRKLVLEFMGYQCVKCRKPLTESTANIHHLSYERVKNETLNDLIPLCKECHKLEHSKTHLLQT